MRSPAVNGENASCGVDDVIITDDLDRRPSRAPDYEAESKALASLAKTMSSDPDTVLQHLVELAIKLTRADSAGISLLEPGGEQGTFRWVATAGAWAPYRDGIMPREESPCGEVVARETVLLMDRPERAFPALLQAEPGVGEGLLAPFTVNGVAAGTVWAIMHGPDRRFEAEDARLLKSLGQFASVAHQMVLALKSAEAGKLASDTRLQALARTSSDVFYIMSADMTELRSLSGGDFIADTTSPSVAWLEDYIPPEDQARTVAATMEAIRTKGDFELEHRVHQADGKVGWALSRAVPILGSDGEIIEWFGAASDITARKAVEETLRDSEARFRALATVGSSSVYRMSPDWREMRHLDGAAFLADADEATFDWVEAYIPPDERPRVREAINRAIADKAGFELEHRVVRADGTIGWTFSRAIPLLDEAGEIAEWFGAASDITERVKADRSFTRLFQAAPAPFLVLKPDAPRFTIAEVNDAYLSATMRTREEVVGRGVFEAYPDNPSGGAIGGMSPLRASFERVLASQQPDTLPGLKYDVARPDGTFEERWWSPVNSAVLDDDGKVEALIHNANDVTVEHLAEMVVRESEERKTFLLRLSDALRGEQSADAIANRALRMLFDEMRLDRCYIVNYRLKEDIADLPQQVHVDHLSPLPTQVRLSDFPDAFRVVSDRTLVVRDVVTMDGLSDADRANIQALDTRALIAASVRKDGNHPLWAIAAVLTVPRVWTQGEVSLVEEVAERTWAAIERARAEVALGDSETRFREMANAAPVLIWETDAAGVVFVNAHYLEFFGVSADEILQMGWAQFLHPEDAAGYLAAYDHASKTRETYTFECRFRRADGQYRWLRNSGVPVGESRIAGGSIDITDLLEAQQQVVQSEARFRQFSDESTNILWIRNAVTMRMEFASPAFDTIYGILGPDCGGDPSLRGWARLIEPESRKTALANFRRVRAGERIEFEFRARRASDGALRWIHNTDFPLHDAAGNVAWLAGIGADITDAKEAADRQGVLVAELQHRTRNLIAVVRSLSERTLSNSASLEDFGKRFRLRLAALSRVQGLLSYLAAGERVTFDELLRSELTAHGATDGVTSKLTLDGPTGVPLRSGSVQTLALALHELSTNAVKYGALAAPNGHLTVHWHVEPSSEDHPPRLHVEWRESGVVMPDVNAAPRGGGYGRELIERALPYQLKAKTSYEMRADGVRCTIAVPISQTTGEGINDSE